MIHSDILHSVKVSYALADVYPDGRAVFFADDFRNGSFSALIAEGNAVVLIKVTLGLAAGIYFKNYFVCVLAVGKLFRLLRRNDCAGFYIKCAAFALRKINLYHLTAGTAFACPVVYPVVTPRKPYLIRESADKEILAEHIFVNGVFDFVVIGDVRHSATRRHTRHISVDRG